LLEYGNEDSSQRSPLNALKPAIATCQVLVVLAFQQHGPVEYSTAAMICGLASTMAIEMLLHQSSGSDDPIRMEERSRLLWSLFSSRK
jgi:hypothetical protein